MNGTVNKVGVKLGFSKWSDVIYADNADINRDTSKSDALLALYDKYPSARHLKLYPYVMASTDSDKKAREYMYMDEDQLRSGRDFVDSSYFVPLVIVKIQYDLAHSFLSFSS